MNDRVIKIKRFMNSRLQLNNIQKKSITILTIIAALLMLSLWVAPIKDDISIRIEYSREFDNDFTAQIFWRGNEDFSEEKSSYGNISHNRVELKIGGDMDEIQELRLDPSNICKDFAITSLQVKNHGVGMQMIPVRDVFEKAKFISVETPIVNLGVLYLKALDNDPMIVFGEELVGEYFPGYTVKLKVILSVWLAIAFLGGLISIYYKCYFIKKINKIFGFICEKYFEITKVILLIAVLLVAFMAFQSFDYAHPDENMSKAAVEYYINHWRPADIRNEEIIDSFSTYGYSRLSETTIYYFLAGKTAWIAKNVLGMSKYYRAFNVLLFVLMVLIYYKKGKKNPWLYMMIGLTPQVWYIFSYTTSDAWDYFLSFIILYQLTAEKSVFNKALNMQKGKEMYSSLVVMGGIFGLLLLGKMNYYFIFVSSFFFLLYKLFVKDEEKRVQILIKYGIVVTVCMLMFGGTKCIDELRYDGNKSEIAQQQGEIYRENAKKNRIQSVSQINQAGMGMRSQGIALEDLLFKHGFLKYSYQSYMGQYGWMEYKSPYGYYLSVGVIYCLILGIMVGIAFRNNQGLKRIIFCLLLFLNLIILATSAWKSWVGDFQPQGRYLFAVNFNMAICTYLYNDVLSDKKILKLAICSLGCFTIYSYIMSGLLFLT